MRKKSPRPLRDRRGVGGGRDADEQFPSAAVIKKKTSQKSATTFSSSFQSTPDF